MYKIDCGINQYVAEFLKTNYSFIIDAEADCNENYGVDDVRYTGTTSTNKIKIGNLEVKSLKNNFYLKNENNEFNPYFNTSNKYGITSKMLFGNVPYWPVFPLNLPEYFNSLKYIPKPTKDEIPPYILNKNVYILNAEDKNHNPSNSKIYKMWLNKTGLVYIAQDGLIIFNFQQLQQAFLGYAWFLNKSHTKEYNPIYDPHYELKALIDLDKGSYYKINIDKELFKYDWNKKTASNNKIN